jgi:hypothetical protein
VSSCNKCGYPIAPQDEGECLRCWDDDHSAGRRGRPRIYDFASLEVGDVGIYPARDLKHSRSIQGALIYWKTKHGGRFKTQYANNRIYVIRTA